MLALICLKIDAIMSRLSVTHLGSLEAENIHIMREVSA